MKRHFGRFQHSSPNKCNVYIFFFKLFFLNSVDPDQLVSNEANFSGQTSLEPHDEFI